MEEAEVVFILRLAAGVAVAVAVITLKLAGAGAGAALVKGTLNLLHVEVAGEGEVREAVHLGGEDMARGTMTWTEAHRRSPPAIPVSFAIRNVCAHSWHSLCVKFHIG
jgi:hypothetical protein